MIQKIQKKVSIQRDFPGVFLHRNTPCVLSSIVTFVYPHERFYQSDKVSKTLKPVFENPEEWVCSLLLPPNGRFSLKLYTDTIKEDGKIAEIDKGSELFIMWANAFSVSSAKTLYYATCPFPYFPFKGVSCKKQKDSRIQLFFSGFVRFIDREELGEIEQVYKSHLKVKKGLRPPYLIELMINSPDVVSWEEKDDRKSEFSFDVIFKKIKY